LPSSYILSRAFGPEPEIAPAPSSSSFYRLTSTYSVAGRFYRHS